MFIRNSQLYKKVATLQGCPDAVASLAFSAEARFIVAVGDFGAKVWDTTSMSEVALPSTVAQRSPPEPKRAFTVASWMYFAPKIHVLLLGSLRGDIFLLSWNTIENAFQVFRGLLPGKLGDEGSQIIAMDVFETVVTNKTGYFVVATLDAHVYVRSLTTTGPVTIFSITLDKSFDLGAVRFGKTRDVYLFGTTGGGIMRLNRETGKIQDTHNRGPDPMGTVSIDNSGSLFVACTGQDFQAYRLQDTAYRQTYIGPERLKAPFSKDTAFAEGGTTLVGGTDSGMAIIYDAQSGKAIQMLEYPRGGLVQPVATCMLKNTCFIAIAGSTLDRSSEVLIFKKHCNILANSTGPTSYPLFLKLKLPKTAGPYIRYLIWLVIFAAALLGFSVLASLYFPEIKSVIQCTLPKVHRAQDKISNHDEFTPVEASFKVEHVPPKAYNTFTPFTIGHNEASVKVASQFHEEHISIESPSQFDAEYALVEALFQAGYVKASLKDRSEYSLADTSPKGNGERISAEVSSSGTAYAGPRGSQTGVASQASETEVAPGGGIIFL